MSDWMMTVLRARLIVIRELKTGA